MAFLVLIKPSAAGYAQSLVQELDSRGFDVGYEPFEEANNVLDAPGGIP
jgi:hypothetical protein